MRLIHFLTFSHIFMAFDMWALYAACEILMHKQYRMDAYGLFVFFSTLFLYNAHRLYGLNNRHNLSTQRYQWAQKHLLTVIVLLLLSGLASFYCAIVSIKLRSIFLLGIVTLISFSYSFPLLPTKEKFIRLKDIPLLKPVFISLVILLVVHVLPQYNQHGLAILLDKTFIIIATIQLCYILALAIIFDVRDVDIDCLQAIKTIPLRYKVSTTLRLAYLLLTMYSLLSYLAYLCEVISDSECLIMILSGIASALTMHGSQKISNKIYYMLAADSILSFQLILFLIAYYLFVQ